MGNVKYFSCLKGIKATDIIKVINKITFDKRRIVKQVTLDKLQI